MASLICPNCGKDNPDFLDDCQFCQTPLRREALNIGEGPTKKTTGELEGVLPDWLKEARQQARDAAEMDDDNVSTQPKIDKVSQDLLAGLAFQAAADDEEEVPDWLASLNPVAEKKAPKQDSAPVESEPPDFFAQFNTQSAPDVSSVTAEAEPAWMPDAAGDGQFRFEETPAQPDSDWLNTLGAPEAQTSTASEDLGWLKELEASARPPAEAVSSGNTDGLASLDMPAQPQEDLGWLNNLGGVPASEQPAQPQEDLSWLNNLGGLPAASQPAQPQEDLGWLNNLSSVPAPEQPAQPQEDLSWLNNLGGVPAAEATPSEQVPQEDLGWLNDLGGLPANEESAAPAATDLDWLNTLGGTPAAESAPVASPAQEDLSWLNTSGDTQAPVVNEEPSASGELDWLNTLGSTPAESASAAPADLGWLNSLGATLVSEEPAVPAPASADLEWLNNLGGTPATEEPAAPAPVSTDLDWLNDLGGSTPAIESAPAMPAEQGQIPDWLKSQTESEDQLAGPFYPTPTGSLQKEAATGIMPDWLKSAADEAASMMPLSPAASADWGRPTNTTDELPPASEISAAHSFEPAATQSTFNEPATFSNEQLDSLLSVDMPDWLTQDTSISVDRPSQNVPTGLGDALSPVDLPSWVQAMRPVDAAVSEAASVVTANQNTERDGPLAGLRGVIPVAPIGSAQRPKALTLKLQVTEEQQSGAALMEQIIAGEAVAQAIQTVPEVASQRVLRWVLSALFLFVTGAFLGLGFKAMPVTVSPAEAVKITNISNVLVSLPQGAPILVVMDYEPALAGEMEAVAGPLLNQAVNLRRPTLTFIASSANGSALVDRLLKNTGAGQAYQPGIDYFNAGYLPGGSTGVQTFIMQPAGTRGTVRANRFADFAAVIVVTDQAESGLVWVEQLTLAKQSDPSLAAQPLLVAASAQAGSMLQPYVTSGQVTGMVAGIAQSAGYEHIANTDRPGLARTYWDAFGAGLMLAVLAIVLGSLWNVFIKLRANIGEQE